MGLFSRKKKGKEMDIPPPPPTEGEEMPEIGIPKEEELSFPEPSPGEEMPELPPLEPEEHIKSELPPIRPKKLEKQPAKMPEFPSMPEEEAPKKLEKEVAEEVEAEEKGPRFLKSAGYRNIMTEMSDARDSLKKLDSTIKSMEKIKEAEDREFQRWRIGLEDAEKKLSYVDRIIFKGE